MPNITFTSLSATGPDDDLVKLAQLLRTEESVSDQICPIPPYAEGGKVWYGDNEKQAEQQKYYDLCKKAFGAESEYDFVNEVWGSKWGITNIIPECVNHQPGTGQLFAQWESAWSPAYGLLYLLARLFPTIEFSFSSTDECNNYEPHTITLKNPQVIVEGLATGADYVVDVLVKKTIMDESAPHYAYFQQDIPKVWVKREGKDVLVARDDATEDELNDEDLEEELEDGPKQKMPRFIGIHFLKAEWYINGFNAGFDLRSKESPYAAPAEASRNLWK